MRVGMFESLLHDWTVLAWLVIAVFVIPATNAISQRCIFRPLGKIVLGIKDSKKTDEDQEKKLTKLVKFEESAWKWLAYGSISAVSAYALHDKPFWRDTRELWTDCTALPCEYKVPVEMRIAYAFDMAYYTYAIPYAVIYETKRKDMYATMIHHILTVALIGYSYMTGFTKVGVVIMFIHDVCDVLLELAKMARYADWELATNVIFGIFTMVWIFMRNYVFPFHVVRSVMWEAHDMLVVKGGLPAWPHYHTFSSLLILLGLLQVYWTVLILKILHKALRGDTINDSRETDDSDSE